MRDTAVLTTTMPPVHPSRWIGRGLRGRATAPSDRSSRARTATLPPLPLVRRTTTGRGYRCGTKGGKVSTMSMIAIRLPASCAALLLIAAAPAGHARVGYVIDGDTFRLESGLVLASPGSTPPKPKRDRPNAGPKSRSAGPRRRAPGCYSTAGLSPSCGSGAAIIARFRG